MSKGFGVLDFTFEKNMREQNKVMWFNLSENPTQCPLELIEGQEIVRLLHWSRRVGMVGGRLSGGGKEDDDDDDESESEEEEDTSAILGASGKKHKRSAGGAASTDSDDDKEAQCEEQDPSTREVLRVAKGTAAKCRTLLHSRMGDSVFLKRFDVAHMCQQAIAELDDFTMYVNAEIRSVGRGDDVLLEI